MSQLLSIGPPATPMDRPARSASRTDRQILRRHHRAERARIGREQKLVAERSFARHPKPVLDDHVGGAALERDLARLGGGKLGRLDVQIRRLVEPARLDHARSPRTPFRSSGSQCAAGRRLRRRTRDKRSQTKARAAMNLRLIMGFPSSATHHPPRRISMPRAGS